MDIAHIKNGVALDYSVENVEGGPDDVHFYVYVVDIEARASPPYAWCAVVAPSEVGMPMFVFNPGFSCEGVPHATVAARAIEAYVVRHANLIALLEDRPRLPPRDVIALLPAEPEGSS